MSKTNAVATDVRLHSEFELEPKIFLHEQDSKKQNFLQSIDKKFDPIASLALAHEAPPSVAEMNQRSLRLQAPEKKEFRLKSFVHRAFA